MSDSASVYVIEQRSTGWVLRLTFFAKAFDSDADLETLKARAFEVLREGAPCELRVRGTLLRWRLANRVGEWVDLGRAWVPDGVD